MTFDELAKKRRISAVVALSKRGQTSGLWDNFHHGYLEDCHFRLAPTIPEYKLELASCDFVRNLYNDPKFAPYKHYIAIHPHVDMIQISGFYYTVSYGFPKNAPNPHPQPEQFDVKLFLKEATIFLYKLHSLNVIHGNMNPLMPLPITQNNDDPAKPLPPYTFRYSKTMMPIQAIIDTNMFSESFILAPVQIIHEMLASKLESANVEYATFKQRFLAFWQHLLVKTMDNLLVLEWAKSYFSFRNGAQDYIDWCITRYCDLTPDHKHVIKDPRKAFGYFKDIDLFQLGITAHMFLTEQPRKITNEEKQYISSCILGEYIDEFKYPDRDMPVFDLTIRRADPPLPPPPPPPPPPQPEPPKPQPPPPQQHPPQLPKHVPVPQPPTPTPTPTPTPHPPPPPTQPQPQPQRTKPLIPEIAKPAKHHFPPAQIQVNKPPPPQPLPPPPPPPQQSKTPAAAPKLQNQQSGGDDGDEVEIVFVGGVKKARIQGQDRVIRSDAGGEYVIWRGTKMYLCDE